MKKNILVLTLVSLVAGTQMQASDAQSGWSRLIVPAVLTAGIGYYAYNTWFKQSPKQKITPKQEVTLEKRLALELKTTLAKRANSGLGQEQSSIESKFQAKEKEFDYTFAPLITAISALEKEVKNIESEDVVSFKNDLNAFYKEVSTFGNEIYVQERDHTDAQALTCFEAEMLTLKDFSKELDLFKERLAALKQKNKPVPAPRVSSSVKSRIALWERRS